MGKMRILLRVVALGAVPAIVGCAAGNRDSGIVDAASRSYTPVVDDSLVLSPLALREAGMAASDPAWEEWLRTRNDVQMGSLSPAYGRRSVGYIDYSDRQYIFDGRIHNHLRIRSEGRTWIRE